MATIGTNPRFQAFTSTGAPLVGGKLYTYAAGTTTPLATYTDSSLTVANADPVILDSFGSANVWLAPSNYKLVLKDASDVTMWTVDNYNGVTQATSATGRNLLINGGFEINQLGGSVTGAATGLMMDGWSFKLTGGAPANYAFSQYQPVTTTGSKYALKATRNAASVDTGAMDIIQDIETFDAYMVMGQTLTLSFNMWVGANFSGTSVTANVLAGTGPADTAWRTAGAYTGQTNISQQTITGLTTSPQAFTVVSNVPMPITTTPNLGVVFQVVSFAGTAGADDSIYIDNVKLEVGGSATSWVPMAWSDELRQCQRRYYKSFPYVTAPAQNAQVAGSLRIAQAVGATTAMVAELPYPSWMRQPSGSAPTVTTYNPSAANAQVRNVTTGTDCTGTTVTSENNSAWIAVTSPGGSAAGNQLAVHYTVDARI